ncbi:MAG: hypothetical protein QOG87_1932 [Actinomycetota bacterium]|jgi:hypothetical protein
MSASTSTSTATAPEQVDIKRVRRVRAVRRVFVLCLTLFLILGLAGVFGVKTTSVEASGGGYDLKVTYARSARPGLAIPWSVEVTKAGGFDDNVFVTTTSSYFDLVDENGFDPDPESSWSSGDDIVWEFKQPEGETLTIGLDARIGPSVQTLWPPEATTTVLVDGEPVVSVKYRTRVWP